MKSIELKNEQNNWVRLKNLRHPYSNVSSDSNPSSDLRADDSRERNDSCEPQRLEAQDPCDSTESLKHWKKKVSALSDDALLMGTIRISGSERDQTAWLIAHLAEVWKRELALKRGDPSIFEYARRELKLSDSMAWDRISCARLALQIPETVEKIASGELNLTSASLLWRAIQEEEKKQKPSIPAKGFALAPAQALLPLSSPVPVPASTPSTPSDTRIHSNTLGSTRAPLQPLEMAEKRDLFQQLQGLGKNDARSKILEWQQERAEKWNAQVQSQLPSQNQDQISAAQSNPDSSTSAFVPVPALPKLKPRPRPRASRKFHSKEWTEMTFYFSSDELVEFDRLRDLLSHRLRSRDPQAVLAWLMNEGLEKVDPLRQEARAEKRRDKKASQEKKKESASIETIETRIRMNSGEKEKGVSESKIESQAESLTSTVHCNVSRHVAISHESFSVDTKHEFTSPSTPVQPSLLPPYSAPAPSSAPTQASSVRIPIPAQLKRKIWIRDQGRCQYQSHKTERVCGSKAFLDTDHIIALADGGTNEEQNLRLACSTHNRRRYFWNEN